MQDNGFFYQAFVYLTAAVVSVPIAKKLGLGSVLGYLIAGILIGPFVFDFIGEQGQDVMHFAEFGVVLMLFLIGLELQPEMLWKLRRSILGIGGLQVGVTALLIMVIAIAAGLAWKSSMAIGLTLALSSTAIVLQTLNEKGLLKTDGGQNAFSVLLFQDITVIPILAILPLLAVDSMGTFIKGSAIHHSETWIDGLTIWLQTSAVMGAVVLIFLTGKYLVGPIFRWICNTRVREVFTAAALLFIISIALLMKKVGLSPALGTFLAGVVLAQSEYRHELEIDIEPFKGLLLGLFFIAVGSSIDFNLVLLNPVLITELVVALILLKFIILLVIGRLFRMSIDNNLLFTFSLAQGGEFAFVLFAFAIQNNVIESSLANILIAVVALSMALTPFLMLFNEKLILPRFGTKEKDERGSDEIDQVNEVIIAGFGRVGSTIGRFLKANGVSATYLDIDPDNVDLLRKMGFRVYYGDASRYDLLHAAGAENARLLIIAVDNPDKAFQIVETVKKHFPDLEMIVRTYGWNDSYELIDIGVEHVFRETLDSALRISAEALSKLGHKRYQVFRAAKIFRKHDEKYLRELAVIRHDRKELIREAKQRIEDLENLLLTEKKNIGKDKDLGWDTASLLDEYGKR